MAENRITNQQKPRIPVKSDVVFSLDVSKSMEPVIEGLKANIVGFLQKVRGAFLQVPIDIRIALVANQWTRKELVDICFLDFTPDQDIFIRAMEKLSAYGDEASLPAIDFSLDLNWRADAHKIVIHFTNETVDRGWEPARSAAAIPDLKNKISDLKVALIIVGKSCPEFILLSQTDRCKLIEIRGNVDFTPENFASLMEKLQKDASTKSKEPISPQVQGSKKDLFGLRGSAGFRLIRS